MLRMTAEEFKKMQGAEQKKKHKYNAKPVVHDGIKFPSTKEGNYYLQLKLEKLTGELIAFYMQVPFVLPGNAVYRLDFLEIWQGSRIEHVDTKGIDTPISRLKRKQVEQIYGIKIKVV